MKIEQIIYSEDKGWDSGQNLKLTNKAQLVLCFASTDIMRNPEIYPQIKLHQLAKSITKLR